MTVLVLVCKNDCIYVSNNMHVHQMSRHPYPLGPSAPCGASNAIFFRVSASGKRSFDNLLKFIEDYPTRHCCSCPVAIVVSCPLSSWSVVVVVGCRHGRRLLWLWLSVVGHGQYTEEGIKTHLLAGVGLPSLLSMRTAQELERAISNNMHHIPGSKTCLIWQNTLRRLALARLNMPPSHGTLNVILVSITSTVRLCNLRNRRKSGYVGVKDDLREKGSQVVGVIAGTLTKPPIERAK